RKPDPGELYVRGLGAERVGLAIELLAEEVQAAADGAALGEQLARRGNVRPEPIELFADIASRDQQRRLLREPLLGDRGHRVAERLHQGLETGTNGVGLRGGG